MGSRGPKKKPDKVLAMRGSPLAKGRKESTVEVPNERPSWPKGWPEEGRRVWRHLLPLLEGAGLLARLDRWPIARYCMTLVYYERTMKLLERSRVACGGDDEDGLDGMDVVGKKDVIFEHPAVKRLERLGKDMLKYEDRFGMSPSARASLRGAVTPPKKKATGKAGYFDKQA